jgi:hypothetical protein
MFVITRSLGKFSGNRRLSDSDMPPAKAQRRQVRREKINILTNDFHVFFPTFAAFASLREIFRVSVAAVRRQAKLFFPAQSGKKRVLLPLKVSAACANFLVPAPLGYTLPQIHSHHEGHEGFGYL